MLTICNQCYNTNCIHKCISEIAMSSLVSIRLSDELFQTMRVKAKMLHLSQTEYVRTAIEKMNKAIEAQERKKNLQQASLRVRKESMKINAEFVR